MPCIAALTCHAMLTIGGFVFLLVCVFGSYLVSGGSIGPLAEALPFEMWTIGGAARRQPSSWPTACTT